MSIYDFLRQLDEKKIFYKLSRICDETISVEVAVPGQRWEIEFFDNGDVRIEKFISDGSIFGKSEIDTLLEQWGE